MTSSAIISLVIAVLTALGVAARIYFVRSSRKTERAETGQRSAEQADDIRRDAQAARTAHEAEIPRLDDDALDADLHRLRAAAKPRKKTSRGGL